jgi:predicted Abi (CAAX) family protease
MTAGPTAHSAALGPLEFVRRRLLRLRRVLTTVPNFRDWGELVFTAALLGGLFGGLGLLTGLLEYKPQPLEVVGRIALTALFVPALGEEVLFRALLIPDRPGSPTAWRPVAVSTVLFTLWHAAETLWLPGARTIFLRPDFLAWAAALGLACAALYRRSGSLWPPILLHWAAVVAWQGWMGGPVGLDALA